MAKKDKPKTAEKKAQKSAKQTKKADKKEKKSKAKGKDLDSDIEDVDLEAVLEEYAKQQAQFLKVTESSSPPPSPRSSSTLLGNPANSNELFLFGGEFYNGALASFYNDLFVYSIPRGEWKKITSPNSPLPRSGHAWTRGGNTGGIYLFGGEFSSPKQGTFYHYNDFWRLDPLSREWMRIESKKGPPARSGHRMTFFKQYIILFGGFQDTSQTTKYLADLWIYDTAGFTWFNPTLPPASQKPDARSSFSFLPHEGGAVLYGGYSRVKAVEKAGAQRKGGAQATKSVMKPMIHQDTWFLRISQPVEGSPANSPPSVRWERRKKPANAPNPARAGATMAFHKSRGILFGGVHDVEESEEGIESEFFNTLFAWNIDRNRFFPLTLRRPRGPSKKQQVDRGGGRRGRGKADEEELLRNLAALETRGSIEDSDTMDLTTSEDKEVEPPPDQPVLDTLPHPRFNAQLAVQDDLLYIFGGTFEQGDREFTFDEMYAIDLGKLDGVKQIFSHELENWVGSDDEEEDEDEEDDEGSEDEEDTGAVNEAETVAVSPIEETPSEATMVEEETEPTVADNRPHPRPFETLRDFYARTSTQWQELLLEEAQKAGAADQSASVKEIRKRAFELAEEKWWDCREEIMALEDEQEEAGIGEVVSIADRESGGNSGPGIGRRR